MWNVTILVRPTLRSHICNSLSALRICNVLHLHFKMDIVFKLVATVKIFFLERLRNNQYSDKDRRQSRRPCPDSFLCPWLGSKQNKTIQRASDCDSLYFTNWHWRRLSNSSSRKNTARRVAFYWLFAWLFITIS